MLKIILLKHSQNFTVKKKKSKDHRKCRSICLQVRGSYLLLHSCLWELCQAEQKHMFPSSGSKTAILSPQQQAGTWLTLRQCDCTAAVSDLGSTLAKNKLVSMFLTKYMQSQWDFQLSSFWFYEGLFSVCYFQITFNCVLKSLELLSGGLEAAGKKFKYLKQFVNMPLPLIRQVPLDYFQSNWSITNSKIEIDFLRMHRLRNILGSLKRCWSTF